jgi:hypothetical protein
MIIDVLIVLSYLTTVVVCLAAFVRALALEGVQWWCYVGYSINSIVLIMYGVLTKQYNLVLNQGVLMITNVIGLYTWRGK